MRVKVCCVPVFKKSRDGNCRYSIFVFFDMSQKRLVVVFTNYYKINTEFFQLFCIRLSVNYTSTAIFTVHLFDLKYKYVFHSIQLTTTSRIGSDAIRFAYNYKCTRLLVSQSCVH